ncbi:hypothetical protein HGG78_15915 [Vibrio aestuarianus]|uniref:hypothetical protein n=1 Tax=Vibrio aestuarianus TaxID=28171 RepID=UPI001558C7B6|nr:hypothetical protein [Vibrio aestuarianus]NGZ15225.1 hypothetical protein [Vibrio aestuarianus]NKZ51373.1 hypothetical protein [Vibrio aestuarianus]
MYTFSDHTVEVLYCIAEQHIQKKLTRLSPDRGSKAYHGQVIGCQCLTVLLSGFNDDM